MKAALLELSKEHLADRVLELEARVPELEKQAARVPELEFRLAQLERMIFGPKQERFISELPEQLSLALGLETTEEAPKTSPESEQISYTRKKKTRKGKPSRQPLPAHLPRKVEIIEPDCDLTGAIRIGEEITEILECSQARFWVRQIRRIKYIFPGQEDKGVVIGQLPSRPIDKAIAGASLLAMIIIDKYVDHLPLYRLNRRFNRAGVLIPTSTLCDWIGRCCELLEPLYAVLVKEVLSCRYLQADESPQKVLDQDKKGSTHLGYQWIYQSPERGLVLFDYRKGRGQEGPLAILANYSGFLQVDGYQTYDAVVRQINGRRPEDALIVLLRCMAHARREFFEARDFDPKLADEALQMFSELYDIERQAREGGFSQEQRLKLRQEKSIPVLDKLKAWMLQNYGKHPPKSPLSKAIAYSLNRWPELCLYTTDGRLEIDNNLAENSIRPLALGRKNYLFAGSHDGARRAAMLYSFLATCKKNDVEPYAWFEDVLNRIKEHPVNRLHELLPGNWKPLLHKDEM